MDGDHLPYQVLAQVISRRFKLTKKIKTINGLHFLFIKNWNNKTSNFAFGNLPDFLYSRDKKPSHSSSEETSSEFDWLERKLTRKQEYIWKTEQVLCKIYFLLSSITYLIYMIHVYIGSKIYIEKIFSKKYPNNIFDWLQGENRNSHKISWEKI